MPDLYITHTHTHTHTHTVIFLAIGLGVFADTDQSFAGYFSVDGAPEDGCLSYGFGISLAAFIINVIATVIGIIAIFYRKMITSKWYKKE